MRNGYVQKFQKFRGTPENLSRPGTRLGRARGAMPRGGTFRGGGTFSWGGTSFLKTPKIMKMKKSTELLHNKLQGKDKK